MTDAERIAQLEADILSLLYDVGGPHYYDGYGWECDECDGRIPSDAFKGEWPHFGGHPYQIAHSEGCRYGEIEARHPFPVNWQTCGCCAGLIRTGEPLSIRAKDGALLCPSCEVEARRGGLTVTQVA